MTMISFSFNDAIVRVRVIVCIKVIHAHMPCPYRSATIMSKPKPRLRFVSVH